MPVVVPTAVPVASSAATAYDIRMRESGNDYTLVATNSYGVFVGAYMFAEQYQQARFDYMGWGTYDRATFLASPEMQDAEAVWYVDNYCQGDWGRFY
jgi:hypothetical protein